MINIHTFLSSCIDALFPPRETELLVRQLTPHEVLLCLRPAPYEHVVTLAMYQNPIMHALIHEAKFHNNVQASKLLIVLLDAYLTEKVLSYDVIIPIPLSRARQRARGFNQVTRVLEGSANAELTKRLRIDLLERTHDTVPQSSLGRAERLRNMEKAFICPHLEQVAGKRILVIDDVATTGATLYAAQKALRKGNPESITLLALAH